MGRKTNSVSLRLNKTNRNYNNSWYSDILYADNFSNSLKLSNYFSQTLKTLDIACPQTSIIGAFKKASVLLCYLDQKKRVRLLEKASGLRIKTPFFSLNNKVKIDPKLLNPVAARATGGALLATGESSAREKKLEKVVDDSFWCSSSYAQTIKATKPKDIFSGKSKTLLKQQQTPTVQAFRGIFETKNDIVTPLKGFVDPKRGLSTLSGPILLNSLSLLTTLMSSKQKALEKHNYPSSYKEQDFRPYYFYRGPLGLEMSLQLLDLQLTVGPSLALKPIKKPILSQNPVLFGANTLPFFLKKECSGEKSPVTCLKTTTVETVQNAENLIKQQQYQNNSPFTFGPETFSYILKTPSEKVSRFKYFFEEFFSGIGYSEGGIGGSSLAFPSGASPLRPSLASPLGEGGRDGSARDKGGTLLATGESLPKNCLEGGAELARKGALQTYTLSSSIIFEQKLKKYCKRVEAQKISPLCAFYKNLFIYGRKSCSTSSTFGPRLCTFSKTLMLTSYYRNPYCEAALDKEPVYVLKNSQSSTLNSLYGFYHSASRFWENSVFLSFYKSTNETCCALFLADTVAYLLERKVLFRSLKRQLLILLNNSKKSLAVSKNLLPELFTTNKNKKVTGIRISCSGRVGGRSKKAQRSRTDTFMWGETGLHVFSSQLDFAKTHAETPFGTVGVQVWVCTK